MNNDKQGYLIAGVVLLITAIIVITNVEYIKNKEKSYEYAYNGEIGVSNKCYLKNDIAYCEVDNTRIQVDNYYEVKEIENVRNR